MRARRMSCVGARGVAVAALAALLPCAAQAQQPDTMPRLDTVRPMSIRTVSEAHERRLTIHRITANAIPPLFAAQYLVGQRLYRDVDRPGGPDGWVRPAHRTGAVLIGTAFAINATTGVMNLWAQRQDPQDRTLRVVHGTTMIAAAAGFTYAGVRLSEQAEESFEKRRQHRQVALASMGLTLASGTLMWWVNR